MSDVNATFNYDADFSSAISQVKLLAKEVSVLSNSFNALDRDARKIRNDFADTFAASVGDLGAFSARTVDITRGVDDFGKALDRNKLKLRQYFAEARKAFNENSNARKLAEDQVRRTKATLAEIGMDAAGRRKGLLVTPMTLDMSDVNTKLEVAKKQFNIFNDLIQKGSTHLVNWGKNTQWAGRQLTVGLTVPMTMFASTTIKAFNDVDKELTRFQKVYGSDLVQSVGQSTDVIRAQVQALAIDIAKTYGIAAKETAGLAADLAATGLEGQKLLDSVNQTTRLAVLGEVDRQDAMKTTLSLQNAFNLNTKQLAESINFLNAVENQTSVSLQDLTDAIPKVGPVVRAMGGDVKDLSVLLVAMKEGGVNAAEGANALKSGLASLINPTKQASQTAKQYGIDLESIVKNNKGKLLPTVLEFQKSMSTLDELGKAKIIEQIFGKYQFARISALFDNLNAAGSQTKQVIELMGASSSDLAKIADQEIKTLTESASMRFQRAMEGIKASLLPVGEAISRSVLPFLEKMSGAIDKVVNFFSNLPEPIKNFLKLAAGFTAISGPLIMITGVLGNFLGYVIKGAMAFVNLSRRMQGLPTEKFELLDDHQIAAMKSTDQLTVSINRQKEAMVGLVAEMNAYGAAIRQNAKANPGFFSSPLVTTTLGGKQVVPSGTKTLPVIKRQAGSWVPGSGSGDKVPAMLEPGEFVVNRNAAKQYGGFLENINTGVPRFQNGGKIPGVQYLASRETPGGPVRSATTGRVYGQTPLASRTSRSQPTPVNVDLSAFSDLSLDNVLQYFKSGKADNLALVEALARNVGIKPRKDATGSPFKGTRLGDSFKKFSWNTREKEIQILLDSGIIDSSKKDQYLSNSQSHIVKETYETLDGNRFKVWRSTNLTPDLDFINNAILQQKEKILQQHGIIDHPITREDYIKLRDVLLLYPKNQEMATAAKILDARLEGDYFERASSFREEISKNPIYGVTSETWKQQSTDEAAIKRESQKPPVKQRRIDILREKAIRAAEKTSRRKLPADLEEPLTINEAIKRGLYHGTASETGLPELLDYRPGVKKHNLGGLDTFTTTSLELAKTYIDKTNNERVDKGLPKLKGSVHQIASVPDTALKMLHLDETAPSISVQDADLFVRMYRSLAAERFRVLSRDANLGGDFARYIQKIDEKMFKVIDADGKEITRSGTYTTLVKYIKGELKDPKYKKLTAEERVAVDSYWKQYAEEIGFDPKRPDLWKSALIKKQLEVFLAQEGTDRYIPGNVHSSRMMELNDILKIDPVKTPSAKGFSIASPRQIMMGRGYSGVSHTGGLGSQGEKLHQVFAWFNPRGIRTNRLQGGGTAKDILADWIFKNSGDIANNPDAVRELETLMSASRESAFRGTLVGNGREFSVQFENLLKLLFAGKISPQDFEKLFKMSTGARGLKSFSSDPEIARMFSGRSAQRQGIYRGGSTLWELIAQRLATPGNKSIDVNSIFPGNSYAGEKEQIIDTSGMKLSSVASTYRPGTFEHRRPMAIFRQNGGSAWVPGSGSGDRVPAMLEPGEFVVNKNAANKYSSLLNDINFNKAPRFATAGLVGPDGKPLGNTNETPEIRQRKAGSPMGRMVGENVASMLMFQITSLIPGFEKLNSTVQMTISSIAAVLPSIAMQKFGGGSSMLQVGKGAVSRGAGALGKLGTKIPGVTSLAARGGVMGASFLGSGASLAAVLAGGAVLAGVAALVYGIYKYKKSLDDAKKAATETFKASAKEAELYGIQLKTVNDAIAENKQLSESLGVAGTGGVVKTSEIDPEKQKQIVDANAELIKRLGNLNKGQQETVLAAKYSSLIQQGFDAAAASEIMSVIGKEANVGGALMGALGKVSGLSTMAPEQQAKRIQENQIAALQTNEMTSDQGKAGFAQGIKDLVSNIQLMPAADQFNAMNNLIQTMNGFSNPQIKLSLDALRDAASENYGKDSPITKIMESLSKDGSKAGLAFATELQAAIDQNLVGEGQLVSIKAALDKGDLAAAQSQLDALTETRNVRIQARIEYEKSLDTRIVTEQEKLNKMQSSYQEALDKSDKSIESENEKYKKLQKSRRDSVKAKQKEIDAINEGTDKYLDALDEQSSKEKFLEQQRSTALGGLEALAGGDVFGFLAAQQQSAAASATYGREQEIKAIEDKRKAAVDAKQAEIDKTQELMDGEDEAHEKRLKNIDDARQSTIKYYSDAIGKQEQLVSSLNGMRGNDSVLAFMGTFTSEADRTKYSLAMINYLMQNPSKSISDALSFVQSQASKVSGSNFQEAHGAANSSGRKEATGGYISGPGTGTSDSIPAMLSNGEYVVKASAVEQYGTSMLDQINTQKYADGGIVKAGGGVVKPASGRITNHYGIRKPYYSKNKDSRGYGEHTGTDFAPGEGSPVLAFKDGDVTGAGFDNGWGNYVKIKHQGNPLYSYYAHLLKKFVGIGAHVTAGTRIGLVGNTGSYSRGAHLHFETGSKLPYTGTTNPEQYLGMARAVEKATIADYVDQAQQASRNATELIPQVAEKMNLSAELLSKAYTGGASAFLPTAYGRRANGGSMTMNKPYLVGENGPEVILPYGSGSRVSPTFSIPTSASGAIMGTPSINTNNTYVTVNGADSPEMVAKHVIRAINKENNRRGFERTI